MEQSRLSEKEIAEIKDFYQHGKGSIQDYARIYRVSVAEILDIVGESDLKRAKMSDGDQVDAAELGPTGRGMINGPEYVDVPFTTH